MESEKIDEETLRRWANIRHFEAEFYDDPTGPIGSRRNHIAPDEDFFPPPTSGRTIIGTVKINRQTGEVIEDENPPTTT